MLAHLVLASAGIFGGSVQAQVLDVCKSGCRFTEVCGMQIGGIVNDDDCSVEESNTCRAGSALASFSDSSITKPYLIRVGPGVYSECIKFSGRTDITIQGSGIDATIFDLWPYPTEAVPNGGVIGIGATQGAAVGTTARIAIKDLSVYSHVNVAPEAAIHLGLEGLSDGEKVGWDDILIDNVRAVGYHDGIQWMGPRDANIPVPPRLTIRNSIIASGHDALTQKGLATTLVQDSLVIAKTNYCESTNATLLAAISGTVVNGGSTTTFLVESADDFGDDATNGRRVTLSGGTCGAGTDGWLTNFDAATDTQTFGPAAGFTPDNTCSYSIAAVPNSANAECSRVDWSTIGGNWKTTGAHVSAKATGWAGSTSTLTLKNVKIFGELNDFSLLLQVCDGGQSHFSGVVNYAGIIDNIILNNVDIDMNVAVDARDGILCAHPVTCVHLAGETTDAASWTGRCRITNSGDADINVSGVVSSSADGAAVLSVPFAYLDIDNTVGSYAGTETYFAQGNSDVLNVGRIVTDEDVTTSGTITMLNGARLDSVTATSSIDFASSLLMACTDSSAITVTGAETDDTVDLGIPNAAAVAGSHFFAWVNAADQVTIRHCCLGAVACDPASATFRVTASTP